MSCLTSGSAFWHRNSSESALTVQKQWACHHCRPHLPCIELHYAVHEHVHVGVPSQLTSLIVRDAEVCCRKMLHSPTLYLLSMPSSCLVTCIDCTYLASFTQMIWTILRHGSGKTGRCPTSLVTRWHPLDLAFRLISHCFHSVITGCSSRCRPTKTKATAAKLDQASRLSRDRAFDSDGLTLYTQMGRVVVFALSFACPTCLQK